MNDRRAGGRRSDEGANGFLNDRRAGGRRSGGGAGGWWFAQMEIVAAEEDGVAAGMAELIDDAGEAFAGVVLLGVAVEGEFGAEEAVVDVGQFEGDHAEADASFPGSGEEGMEPAVDVGLEVGWFGEAFGALILGHVVVANLEGEGANAFAFGADFGEEPVGHPAEHGFDVGFVGEIGFERFLVTEGFLGFAGGDERSFVDAVGELAQGAGLAAEQQFEQIERGFGNMADLGEAGGVEAGGGFGTDAGEPAVGQGMEERDFVAERHRGEGGGFMEFGSDLADEFVRGEPFADGDFERLPNGVANGFGDFDGRFLVVGGEIEVTFVDGGLLDVRGEVVAVTEHPVGELFVAFEIAGEDDEFGAEFACPGGGHGGVNAELAGFVGGGGDDAAVFAADGDWFAAQPGIGGLLDGGEEGVGIQMDDGSHKGEGRMQKEECRMKNEECRMKNGGMKDARNRLGSVC